MLPSSESWPSSMETSMAWPRPVRSFTRRASMMPKAAYIPAVMSAMETPQRTPCPPASPVVLIIPLARGLVTQTEPGEGAHPVVLQYDVALLDEAEEQRLTF